MYKKHILKLINLSEIFNFSYLLISNFPIKDSELSSLHDFSNLINLKFPNFLHINAYEKIFLKNLENNKLPYNENSLNNQNDQMPKYLNIFKIASFSYIENFANLNNHNYYLGELTEYYYKKIDSINSNNLKAFEDLNLKENLGKNSKENKPFSFKEELDNFLTNQINNNIIHFTNVNNPNENNNNKKDLDIFEKENLINMENQKLKLTENSNKNKFNKDNYINFNDFSREKDISLSNFSKKKIKNFENESLLDNNRVLLNTLEENLSEFLSNCQKLILLSAFIASELPEKYDKVIFKSSQRTNIGKKVKYS